MTQSKSVLASEITLNEPFYQSHVISLPMTATITG